MRLIPQVKVIIDTDSRSLIYTYSDIGRTYRFDDDGVRVTPGIDLHESLEELHDDDDDSDDLQDLLQTTFVSNPTKMAIRYSKRKKRETNNEVINIMVSL